MKILMISCLRIAHKIYAVALVMFESLSDLLRAEAYNRGSISKKRQRMKKTEHQKHHLNTPLKSLYYRDGYRSFGSRFGV